MDEVGARKRNKDDGPIPAPRGVIGSVRDERVKLEETPVPQALLASERTSHHTPCHACSGMRYATPAKLAGVGIIAPCQGRA